MLGLSAHRLFKPAQRPLSVATLARERCTARSQSEPAVAQPEGFGWFDSSHALLEGLTVVEHHSLHGDTLELAVALLLH